MQPALKKKKDFYFTPKLGWSLYTGLLGAELKYKKVSLNFGVSVKDIYGMGIKYYFEQFKNSYYLGMGGFYRHGDNPSEQKTEKNYVPGIVFGHCWKW